MLPDVIYYDKCWDVFGDKICRGANEVYFLCWIPRDIIKVESNSPLLLLYMEILVTSGNQKILINKTKWGWDKNAHLPNIRNIYYHLKCCSKKYTSFAASIKILEVMLTLQLRENIRIDIFLSLLWVILLLAKWNSEVFENLLFT